MSLAYFPPDICLPARLTGIERKVFSFSPLVVWMYGQGSSGLLFRRRYAVCSSLNDVGDF